MGHSLQVGRSEDANALRAINAELIYSFIYSILFEYLYFEHPHPLISILNSHFEYPGIPSL